MIETSEDRDAVSRDIRPSEAVKAYEGILKAGEAAWRNWTRKIGPFVRERTDKAKQEAGSTRGPIYAAFVEAQMKQFYPIFQKLSNNGTLSYLGRVLDDLEAVEAFRNRMPEDQRPAHPMRVWTAYEASLRSTIEVKDEDQDDHDQDEDQDEPASRSNSQSVERVRLKDEASVALARDDPDQDARLRPTGAKVQESVQEHGKREPLQQGDPLRTLMADGRDARVSPALHNGLIKLTATLELLGTYLTMAVEELDELGQELAAEKEQRVPLDGIREVLANRLRTFGDNREMVGDDINRFGLQLAEAVADALKLPEAERPWRDAERRREAALRNRRLAAEAAAQPPAEKPPAEKPKPERRAKLKPPPSEYERLRKALHRAHPYLNAEGLQTVLRDPPRLARKLAHPSDRSVAPIILDAAGHLPPPEAADEGGTKEPASAR